jgi:hypothetical protein
MNPIEPLDQVYTHPWSTLVKDTVKPGLTIDVRPEAARPEGPAPRVAWHRARSTSACDGRANLVPVCTARVPAAYKGSAALCFVC